MMPGLFEKPLPVTSGKPIHTKVVRHHRSDFLMREQIREVTEAQDALQSALDELEKFSRDSEEYAKQLLIVKEQKYLVDELTIVLLVVDKLNNELFYARENLRKVLKSGENVYGARKRVVWLEGRMEQIVIHKARNELLEGRVSSESSASFKVESTIDSEEETQLEKHVIIDVDEKQVTSVGSDNGSDDISIADGTDVKDAEAEEEDKIEDVDEDKREAGAEEDKVEATTEEDDITEGVDEEVQSKASSKDDEPEIGISDDEEQNKESVIDETLVDDDKSNASTNGEQAFLTEVAESNDAKLRSRSVTVKSPDTEDLADLYWKSEHHRYEYGDHAQPLCDLDHLSYHQVGLAIPGTFVSKIEQQDINLPWRPSRKGSVQDIHKIALDKLSMRVHKMYNSLYSAAMLSVDPHFMDKAERGTFLQNVDLDSMKPDSASTRDVILPTIVQPADRPKTKDSASLPDTIHPKSARLVYHSKPIPRIANLPLTQVSWQETFPRKSTSFVSDSPRERAERIVDQRNLIDETKFSSSLFHEKKTKSRKGLSTGERRLQELLEIERQLDEAQKPPVHQEETPKRGKQQLKKVGKIIKIASQFSSGQKTQWGKLKPRSGALQHSGLKWERIKHLVHSGLMSERPDERIDAAIQLGKLRCPDTMVLYQLRSNLKTDPVHRVRYEAAKSLVLLGSWDEDVMKLVVCQLGQRKNTEEIKLDLVTTIYNGYNIQYMDKKIKHFDILLKILNHFTKSPGPDNKLALESAICLGKLCVADVDAKKRLYDTVLSSSADTHTKANALDVLVRQMNCHEPGIVNAVLDQLCSSPVWKYRHNAAKLIITLGSRYVLQENPSLTFDEVFERLEWRLWDDLNKLVRLEVAKAITALGMFNKACERAEKNLEDADDDKRAQAVISIGTLGIKRERVVRLLLEMLELDSSEYVRLQIVRTFGMLQLYDKRVLRSLKDRDRGADNGKISREAKKSLKAILHPNGETTKTTAVPKIKVSAPPAKLTGEI
ncbi:uncharacterized protein LOC141903632 isoform X2 [Tubulanus polymorphus]|uniref:uncharacterized protein LOC141903632 isoform X2 n=1 Tax=Tubulanus polymorphus TaxID=672921 RepID=UPI003DA3CAC7